MNKLIGLPQKGRFLLLAIAMVIIVLATIAIGMRLHDKDLQQNEISKEKKLATSPAKDNSKTYRITLDLDGAKYATVEPEYIDARKGKPVSRLPIAYEEGKRFVGWYIGKGDDAALVDNASLSLLPQDKDTTLYARFEIRPTDIDTSVKGLPVIMYHYFYNPAMSEVSENANWMNINSFDEQVKYLTDNGYYFPTWEEVTAFIYGEARLPEKSVVLTSDDGSPSFYVMAIPVIEKYKAHITGFIITSANPDNIDRYDPKYVTFKSHSHDMHRSGSDGKGRFLTSSPGDIAVDIQSTYEYLGSKDILCYPFGHTSETVQNVIKENGVKLAFTVQPGLCYPMMNPLELPRVRMNEGTSLESFITKLG